jgi:hypothetical protein
MRYLVMVKATKDSEAGVMPEKSLVLEMGAYNEELAKAGVLLAADGLQRSSKGARVRFDGKSRTVIDGPFAETKELVAGFWIMQAKSLAEVIEWVKRAPNPHPFPTEVEIRQVIEPEEWGDMFTPEEWASYHERIRNEEAAKARG